MKTAVQHPSAEHITPENTYLPLSDADVHISILAWRPSSEKAALRKIKELGWTDLEVPDGAAHTLIAHFYERERVQKKIEALLHKGKLPLYEWPSRIRTADPSGAFVNQAELVALLTSGAHLDDNGSKGAQATEPLAAPTTAPSASTPAVARPAPVAAPAGAVAVPGAGGDEKPVQRRERLRRRVDYWKAQGVRDFTARVAAEERVTEDRIRKILSKGKTKPATAKPKAKPRQPATPFSGLMPPAARTR